jgi:hypothetical protein
LICATHHIILGLLKHLIVSSPFLGRFLPKFGLH